MVVKGIKKTVVAIRDQLGKLDDTTTIGVWDYDEELGIEEGPTSVKSKNTGPDTIWDHPTAIWDTATWDDNYTNDWVVVRVINPNNIFHDHFRDNDFEDTTNSTATWDTTNFRLEFISGKVGQTLSIFQNQESVASVLPNINAEGISVTVKIDKTTNPGGVQKDIT